MLGVYPRILLQSHNSNEAGRDVGFVHLRWTAGLVRRNLRVFAATLQIETESPRLAGCPRWRNSRTRSFASIERHATPFDEVNPRG
jgi:hypothetical protein